MAGRPTRLTPKLRESICQSIRVGNYAETAAAMNGIAKQTFYNWVKRGSREKERLEKSKRAKPKPAERKFVAFVDAVKKAEAIAESRDVALIAHAAQTQWQAAAWRLERKNYKRWGRRQLIEHTGEDGAPIETKVNVVEMEFYGKPEKEDGEG